MFPKQAANSLVTETSQYFVFFCRSVCSANLAKYLIINVLRLIIVILFFIAFPNITYCARHTFACMAVEYGMPIDVLAKILGHSNTNMTRHYAKFSETVIGRAMEAFGERLASAASAE
ncbi:MAG: tyrosine-type recombinase/integrase [Alistipes putredinis]|nr:tyrosine-type recombinase/integrase [Alistipes putredinis]